MDAYLERIGAPHPAAATLDALAGLTLAHLYSVPFENLDIAAGRRLSVELGAIHDKIVTRHRGGFCYELNGPSPGSCASSATTCAPPPSSDARRSGTSATCGASSRPRRPLARRRRLGEAYRRPVRALRATNTDPPGTYRLEERDGGWQCAVGTTPVARGLPLRPPRGVRDFGEACRWQETESPFFTRHRFCSIATPAGRATLMDDRLIVSSAGRRTEREVDPDEVPALLAEHFGVVL
jgi:N-hydroxyarylamine O-acetyltransferase